MDAHITVSLAGFEAERAATGAKNSDGARHDYDNAVDLLFYMVGSTEEAEVELERLRTRAVHLLSGNWLLVERVAEALQAERTLSWERIRQLTEPR